MSPRSNRLTELTSAEIQNLHRNADELDQLQAFLNRLPLGLKVEDLSDQEFDRLRQIESAPLQELCGARLLVWNNMCRLRKGLKTRT